MASRDRPRVKLECLRLLATLQLNPAKARLIGGFIESYLKLTADEMRRYEREFEKLLPEEKEKTVEVLIYWEQKGLDQGLEKGMQQGKEQIIVRQIAKRFGSVQESLKERLEKLSSEQLDELGVALLDFTVPNDVENWLAQHISQ